MRLGILATGRPTYLYLGIIDVANLRHVNGAIREILYFLSGDSRRYLILKMNKIKYL